MNYRHAYHAGNFADVLKHLTLALVIDYMKRKEAPFRVIDTHAGAGRYALLSGVEATKTGEWRGGISRVLGADAKPLPYDVAEVMTPYLKAVRAENPRPGLKIYPGSPLIARRLMRPQDVLVANELHPEDGEELRAALRRDPRVKVLSLDGWVALKSLLPPKERRGVVLIDPSFEQEGELARLAQGLVEGLQRFESGVYVAWYPIKDFGPVAAFHEELAARVSRELLRVELLIRGSATPDRLNGCGLIVANPPFTLRDHLAIVLPELTRRLADGAGARHRLDGVARITREQRDRSAASHRRTSFGTPKRER
jgi:23S rRNA (adenine2030-N6)-methyltransferase